MRSGRLESRRKNDVDLIDHFMGEYWEKGDEVQDSISVDDDPLRRDNISHEEDIQEAINQENNIQGDNHQGDKSQEEINHVPGPRGEFQNLFISADFWDTIVFSPEMFTLPQTTSREESELQPEALTPFNTPLQLNDDQFSAQLESNFETLTNTPMLDHNQDFPFHDSSISLNEDDWISTSDLDSMLASFSTISKTSANLSTTLLPSTTEPSRPSLLRFSCPVSTCTRTYKRIHELRRHRITHTGAKPHLCRLLGCKKGVAGNGFARADHRTQHERRVHGFLG